MLGVPKHRGRTQGSKEPGVAPRQARAHFCRLASPHLTYMCREAGPGVGACTMTAPPRHPLKRAGFEPQGRRKHTIAA